MREIIGFLEDFESFRLHCDSVDYSGMVNPVDGVFYPGVSLDIPESIREEIVRKLEILERGKVEINALFLRLSLKGVEAPHQAHTDALMGKKSLMLYLNKEDDCSGGTSLVRHICGMDSNPVSDQEEMIWQEDTNNPDKWEVTRMCGMYPNKAFIFDAHRMHRAEPVGGFGEDATNGRLVLTAFYDC